MPVPIMRRTATRVIRPFRSSLFSRGYSDQTKPDTTKAGASAHTNFYKTFTRPFAKVFLGALFTYQVLHWSWLKLESLETKHQTAAELERLEGQIQSLSSRPAR
ncbi:hypothetical protein P152DRAFT_471328 [Eremomyces bilateralis CBS 781.70]|uniref:Inner membrane assembly complex subunit 17 n=1 Tax=Eremomyces bilateralis CBS 781.70 TaxID=1392243 RepID=A0A6G1GDH5_9PEZI|nr:uncharacterized protein P152DRAFT_471328 [Eremomyces bilateralis CBS 781.70]KAF1815966.1 hypothetical protein P152DRAFT_471328 [Eremomyces bilateralis CBS 781.70]